MAGWNPQTPQLISARLAPLPADALAFQDASAGSEMEILFIIRNPGPDPVILTWGREDATLPNPLPALSIPAPEPSDPPTAAQFGPFNNRMSYWFIVKDGGDDVAQEVTVDVYTKLAARR